MSTRRHYARPYDAYPTSTAAPPPTANTATTATATAAATTTTPTTPQDPYIYHYTFGVEYNLDGTPVVGGKGAWSLDKRNYYGQAPDPTPALLPL